LTEFGEDAGGDLSRLAEDLRVAEAPDAEAPRESTVNEPTRTLTCGWGFRC
jgi:hypothetical protein